MINYKAIISIIVVVVQLSSSTAYIIDTLKGKTKPNRISYLIWSSLIIAGLATNSAGFSWSTLPVIVAGISPLIIFICSFANKNAYWKLGLLDYTCGLFAVLALALWYLTKNPLTALILIIIVDILACLPTFIKIVKYPETETKKAYSLYAIAHTINLLAVSKWTLIECLTPLYLVIINWILFISFYIKKRRL